MSASVRHRATRKASTPCLRQSSSMTSTCCLRPGFSNGTSRLRRRASPPISRHHRRGASTPCPATYALHGFESQSFPRRLKDRVRLSRVLTPGGGLLWRCNRSPSPRLFQSEWIPHRVLGLGHGGRSGGHDLRLTPATRGCVSTLSVCWRVCKCVHVRSCVCASRRAAGWCMVSFAHHPAQAVSATSTRCACSPSSSHPTASRCTSRSSIRRCSTRRPCRGRAAHGGLTTGGGTPTV